jgi:hypothetical protein
VSLNQLPILDKIPEPDVIRERLAQLVRERSLLRRLLKVSQEKQAAAQQERQRRGGVEHAA